jgi:hypothetical protein
VTWAAFARRAYQAARDWGIQPSEFWSMSPQEWWWEMDARLDTQDEINSIRDGKGQKGGGFTKAEWSKARAEHKAKMNDRT